MRNRMILFVLVVLLLSGCGKNEVPPIVENTMPEETTLALEMIPTEASEAAAPEETEPKTDDFIWQGLYWMEGESRPQLRCLITNEEDSILTVESVSAVYYLAENVVKEDYFDSSALKYMVQNETELSYMESTCIWITNDLSIEEYNTAVCTVSLRTAEESSSLEFHFTTNNAQVTPVDPFAGEETSYATNDGSNWGFFYFPVNNTPHDLTLEAWYWVNYLDGAPVITGTFTRANLPPTASELKTLSPDESMVHNNGISTQWCNYNQREDIFVFRNMEGEPYIQSFRFLLDEENAPRIEDILFPGDESGNDDKVTLENPEQYASVIDFYNIPSGLGEPEYTVAQIREMIDADLTLDQVAQKISTYADLLQYLYLKGYEPGDHDVHFWYGGTEWSVSYSPQVVFERNYGNCGGGSNLVNYILRGDYDEQGYFHECDSQGAHVYNYFKQDGTYYFLDLTQIVATGEYDNSDYVIFETEDPTAFFSMETAHRNQILEDKRNALLLQWMYPYEGNQRPVSHSAALDIFHQTASEMKDRITVVYLMEDKYDIVFADAPMDDLWPEETQ